MKLKNLDQISKITQFLTGGLSHCSQWVLELQTTSVLWQLNKHPPLTPQAALRHLSAMTSVLAIDNDNHYLVWP